MNIKLDDDNNYVFENNRVPIIDGADYVRQKLQTKLRLFLGEWFLDLNVGVPYFQDILKKQVSTNVIASIFKDVILETPGVIELQEFVLDYDNIARDLKLDFTVRSETGSITINLEDII